MWVLNYGDLFGCMWMMLQEGMVPFDIGVPISGDVAIGLWFGAYNLGQRLHSRPAAAYAFHTAFFEENKVGLLHSTVPSAATVC